MLELIKEKPRSMWQLLHLKFDLIYSEIFSSYWVIAELNKIKRVKQFST